LDWKRTTVDEIVEQKRRLGEKYKWVLKMLLPHVVGRQVWKNQVETGNRKPSKVVTTSDEALLLVAMDCYRNVWVAKAKHKSENGNREYPTNMPSHIYIKENSQKSSWSNNGVTQFNELMEEVEQDQNSVEGKQFKIEFQSDQASCLNAWWGTGEKGTRTPCTYMQHHQMAKLGWDAHTMLCVQNNSLPSNRQHNRCLMLIRQGPLARIR
jgi:hypothetical protein